MLHYLGGLHGLKDAWGVQIAGGTPSERYGFAQREHDTESGLVHVRARSYDPRYGRFIQKDPIRSNVPLTHYVYAANNPAGRVDPRGLEDVDPAVLEQLSNYAKGQFGEDALYDKIQETGTRVVLHRNPNAAAHGADLITLDTRTGVVEFFDNKVDLKKYKNISSVDALLENFSAGPSMANAERGIRKAIADKVISEELGQMALRSMKSGHYVKYLAGSGGKAIGITSRLRKAGLLFFSSGNRARLVAAQRAASRLGRVALAARLGKVLAIGAGGAGAIITAVHVYQVGKEEGLDAAQLALLDDMTAIPSLMEGMVAMANEASSWLNRTQTNIQYGRARKEYGSLGSIDKELRSYYGITEEDVAYEELQPMVAALNEANACEQVQ